MAAYLEASGTPVDELDGPLGLDGGDRRVDVLGHDVAAVQQAAGHVLSLPRVTLKHSGPSGRLLTPYTKTTCANRKTQHPTTTTQWPVILCPIVRSDTERSAGSRWRAAGPLPAVRPSEWTRCGGWPGCLVS